jgi:hypothetical protein
VNVALRGLRVMASVRLGHGRAGDRGRGRSRADVGGDAAWGHAAYKRPRKGCVRLAVRHYGRANQRFLSSLPGLDVVPRRHPPLKRVGYYRSSHEGTGIFKA